MKNLVLVVAILALAVIAVSVLAPGNPLSRLFRSKKVVVVTGTNRQAALIRRHPIIISSRALNRSL